MRTAALIAAAGAGSRLGQGPKAFVTVRGRSLLDMGMQAFADHVDEVVVSLPAESVAGFQQRHPEVTVVPGGATRQASVAAMLAATDASIVLVHDVARPFLTLSVLERVVAAARATGAATAVLDVADTVLDVRTGATLERAHLRLVQTPQGFARELLEKAHVAARAADVIATDDAELVRRIGHPVELVQGSPLLHKLTSDDDLAVVEALYDLWLSQRRREAAGG